MKYLISILFVIETIALQSCIDCGPQAELNATVEFSGDSIKIDTVYALKALNQEAIQWQSTRSPASYVQLTLPISLVSDTTNYIFKLGNRIDTLSIFYERVFRYKGGCGFINDARQPSSGSHYRSTFKQVEVSYSPYVRPGKQPFPGKGPDDGIMVRIRL